jgi:predicted anti-sigma-YlaC factor YlaD
MECELIQMELVDFHFGTVRGDLRHPIENHLGQCGSCLNSFLEVKRNVEMAESDREPSPEAEKKLRQTVRKEFTRRVPFYLKSSMPYKAPFIAASLAIFVVGVVELHRWNSTENTVQTVSESTSLRSQRIDTDRETGISLDTL